eukprot:766676-Hanusia_phi.AAC.6
MEESGRKDLEAAQEQSRRAQDIAYSSKESDDLKNELRNIEKDLHILQGKVERDEELRLSPTSNKQLSAREHAKPLSNDKDELQKPKSLFGKDDMDEKVEKELYRLISKIVSSRGHEKEREPKHIVNHDRFLVKEQPKASVSANPFDWIVHGLKSYGTQGSLHPDSTKHADTFGPLEDAHTGPLGSPRIKPYVRPSVSVRRYRRDMFDPLSPELQAHRALASAEQAIRAMHLRSMPTAPITVRPIGVTEAGMHRFDWS